MLKIDVYIDTLLIVTLMIVAKGVTIYGQVCVPHMRLSPRSIQPHVNTKLFCLWPIPVQSSHSQVGNMKMSSAWSCRIHFLDVSLHVTTETHAYTRYTHYGLCETSYV